MVNVVYEYLFINSALKFILELALFTMTTCSLAIILIASLCSIDRNIQFLIQGRAKDDIKSIDNRVINNTYIVCILVLILCAV